MNGMQKVVFAQPNAVQNTTLVKDDIAGAVRRMKSEPGPGMVILGSSSIVAQLTQAGLIDEYQIVVHPVVLGQGKTMFAGITTRLSLRLTKTRAFGNGRVVLWYEPVR
jgi:dihydrofolate reductase